jgi:2-polyprenyl-3-methyl-5-hydroxy-6-metoxy-1,4-benzoquinol methylase
MINKYCQCCQSEDVTMFSESSFLKTAVLRCNNCHFIFNEITDEDEINSFLKDYYTNDYWQVSREKGINRVLKKILNIRCISNIRNIRFSYQRALSQLKYSDVSSGEALEIGAGRGALSILLATKGFKTTTVEPDKNNIQHINNSNSDIAINNCYFDQFQSDKTFDIVFASHVLEHDLHPIEFIEKIRKLLNTNGTAFIEIPNADNPATLNISIHDEPHVTHFSRKSIECLFTRMGFKILKFDSVSYGYRSKALKQIVKTLKFLLFRADIYKETPDSKGDAYRVLIKNF